jgi:hypothetical protein
MKRLLFILVSLLVVTGLFANFTPYGSARLGFFYNIEDEDWCGVKDGYMYKDMHVFSSFFGFDYTVGNTTAKIELGFDDYGLNLPSFRAFWAKHQFDGWSLMAGLDDAGTLMLAQQAGFGDNDLIALGALISDAMPMVRFEMDNGFYASLIQNNFSDPYFHYEYDALIPKINLGYKMDFDAIKIHPSVAFQMHNENEEYHKFLYGDDYDTEAFMSWVFGVLFEYDATPFNVKLHANFGANTGLMGYVNHAYAGPVWDGEEYVDAMTFGGFLTFGYDINDDLNINLGFGYSSTTIDIDAIEDDAIMGLYLQGIYKFSDNFSIVPEFGMIMPQDLGDFERGSVMYFGTQLRFEF